MLLMCIRNSAQLTYHDLLFSFHREMKRFYYTESALSFYPHFSSFGFSPRCTDTNKPWRIICNLSLQTHSNKAGRWKKVEWDGMRSNVALLACLGVVHDMRCKHTRKSTNNNTKPLPVSVSVCMDMSVLIFSRRQSIFLLAVWVAAGEVMQLAVQLLCWGGNWACILIPVLENKGLVKERHN